MRRADVIAKIQAHRQELARFRVKSLSVFGSVARDEARDDSDVDVLVEFDGFTGMREHFGLQDYLEELLGARVDVVTLGGLRKFVRAEAEREAVRVA